MKRFQNSLFAAVLVCSFGLSGLRGFGALAQEAYVKASNTGAYDQFGTTVAISGDTMIVGAPQESSNAQGVNGAENNDEAFLSGAAYIYVRSGTNWTQQAYLKASDSSSYFSFGSAVTIDGNTAVVGAPSAFPGGSAYVFVRTGTNWTQQQLLKASNAGGDFGGAVSLAGNTVVIGARSENSDASGVNGVETNYTSFSSGAAYVFVRDGTTWAQQAFLKASNADPGDQFGGAVGVAGDTIVVGAREERSSATGVNGDEEDDSSLAGAAYVFARTGTNWTQQAYLKASNTGLGDGFGSSVAVAGDTVVVGAPDENSLATGVNGVPGGFANDAGAAYVFIRTNGTVWTQQAYLKAFNTEAGDQFGISVAVAGDTVIVGAREEDSHAAGVDGNQASNTGTNSGAAYLYARSGTNWSTQSYLKASNPGGGNSTFTPADAFGSSVALSGGTFVIGAPGEASNATGVNGNQGDNSLLQSGAAYVFQVTPGSYYGVPRVMDFGSITATQSVQRSFFIGNAGPTNLYITSIFLLGDLPAIAGVTHVVTKVGGGVVTLPHLIPTASPSEALEVSVTWRAGPTGAITARLIVSYDEPGCTGCALIGQDSIPITGERSTSLVVTLEEGFWTWLFNGLQQGKAIQAAGANMLDAVQTITLALDPSVQNSLTAEVPFFLGGGSVQLSNFTGSVTLSLLSMPNDSGRKIIRIDSGSMTAPSVRLPSGLMTGLNLLTFGPPEQSGGTLFLTNGSFTAYATATITNNLIPDGVTVQGNYSGIYNAQTGGISLQSASRDLFEPSERVLLTHAPNALWLTWANTNAVEEATDVTGPWRTVTNAVSPYLVITTNLPQQFFRLKQPAP